ncbi:probable plastidic glucose transporter 3 isoform X2 [Vitis vinifera]|uniref:probable plastidic glucose transporter 3 isoform X2 n=1 Tax=Vitis vinifera TaxID=29760 RepID=UPI00053FAC42|nr:probable plastidic glucose transporter 3 isoform X2 [Vitis vinifera]
MRERQYKRTASKDYLTGLDREESIVRFHNVAGKESGNPSWSLSLPHILVATVCSFLFGYHLGVVNETLEIISLDLGFNGSTLAEGLVVSTCLGGAFVGSLFSGWIADGIGRRRAFQLCALPMIIGASMSATTRSLEGMLLGRFLVGTGMGIGPPVVSLYVAEVSPTFVRGTFGSFTQIATCIGLIGALLIGIPAKEIDGWWRVCFWVSAFPAAILAFLMEFSAESPHWLLKKGRAAEAEAEFEKLLGGLHVKSAIAELLKLERGEEVDAVKLSDLFFGHYFRAFWHKCCVLFLFNCLQRSWSTSRPCKYVCWNCKFIRVNHCNDFDGQTGKESASSSEFLRHGSLNGPSSHCSEFFCIRIWSIVSICRWHAAVCLDIFSGCWSSPRSPPCGNIPQPN